MLKGNDENLDIFQSFIDEQQAFKQMHMGPPNQPMTTTDDDFKQRVLRIIQEEDDIRAEEACGGGSIRSSMTRTSESWCHHLVTDFLFRMFLGYAQRFSRVDRF